MAHQVPDVRFRRLQSFLDDGWNIDPPIFVRPVWYSLSDAQSAYHFILKRAGDLQLLVVPACDEVDQFVRDRRLPLNHL